MTGVIKVLVEMPEYCAICGYQCCTECKIDGESCSMNNKKPVVCSGYPFYGLFFNNVLKGYSGPFGVLGIGGWYVTSKCKGLNIKLPGNDKTLGSKLEVMKQEINNYNNIKELSDEDKKVKLIVLKADPEEIADLIRRSELFLKKNDVSYY